MKHISPWLVLGVLSFTLSRASLAEPSLDAQILSQNEDEDRSVVSLDSLPVEVPRQDDQEREDFESQRLPSRKSRRIPRERDAEGTQAPHRFENDILMKSRYELNGQPLEVDTD